MRELHLRLQSLLLLLALACLMPFMCRVGGLANWLIRVMDDIDIQLLLARANRKVARGRRRTSGGKKP